MTNDALEILDDEDIEEEVDQQVDEILFEVTKGILGKAGTALESPSLNNNTNLVEEDEEDDSVLDLDEMRSRLSALKG
ncbi:hypothetical protein AYI69_g9754 [Smittium culicis]|nr:hypothetical protein AYI69_g9754 [Smittium culicis]